MEKEKSLMEMLNMSSENYRQKVAISKNFDINYFCYKFDVEALKIAMNRLFEKSNKITTAIISENRQEWVCTYIANIIMGNDVVIVPSNIKAENFNKIVNKYKINTIFYSNSYREKIIKFLKNRKAKKENIKLNLINFDPEKNLNVINYTKIMNVGRYLENNLQLIEKQKNKEGKTIFAGNNEEIFSTSQIIENTLKIVKKIHIWNFWNKKLMASNFINNEYDLYFQIFIPLLLGSTINFNLNKYKNRDLIIQKSNMEFCEICKKKKIYRIWKEKNKFEISISKKKELPKFKVIENKNVDFKIKDNYRESFILIK